MAAATRRSRVFCRQHGWMVRVSTTRRTHRSGGGVESRIGSLSSSLSQASLPRHRIGGRGAVSRAGGGWRRRSGVTCCVCVNATPHTRARTRTRTPTHARTHRQLGTDFVPASATASTAHCTKNLQRCCCCCCCTHTHTHAAVATANSPALSPGFTIFLVNRFYYFTRTRCDSSSVFSALSQFFSRRNNAKRYCRATVFVFFSCFVTAAYTLFFVSLARATPYNLHGT